MTQQQLTPHQILAAARLLIFKRAPYFHAGILNLVARETPGLGTFATTKDWIVLWDPEKVAEWGIDGTAAVIVHKLWHLIRDHFGRFSAPLINKDIGNIAGDLSINPGVRDMGFKFPKDGPKNKNGKKQVGGLWPKDFKLDENLTAEQYYEALMKMDVKYAFFDAEGEDGQKLPGGMTVIVEGCGSCSGRKRHDEPAEGDREGRSEGEIQRTKIIIAKAIQGCRRGSVPSDLSRWSDEALAPPKIRWQDKLARVCRAAIAYRPGSGHSTYTKVARRQAGVGFGPGCPVLPSYRATVPRVTFLVDTSGSMGADSLAKAMSEAQGIFTVCGATLDVVVCDAAVHGAKKVNSIKEACAMLKGGGGSDFNPAFEEISRRRPKSDIVVAATDGDISVPAHKPPGMEVIWLLVQKSYGDEFRRPCDWGTAIEVDA